MAFEVQQNSDVTFRLYDWDHVDAATGKRRTLQIEQAFASIDFVQGRVVPVTPEVEAMIPVMRERLFFCEYFSLWRLRARASVSCRRDWECRAFWYVFTEPGIWSMGRVDYIIGKGVVMLLPAVVGACIFQPFGEVCLFEIALPESILQYKNFDRMNCINPEGRQH